MSNKNGSRKAILKSNRENLFSNVENEALLAHFEAIFLKKEQVFRHF